LGKRVLVFEKKNGQKGGDGESEKVRTKKGCFNAVRGEGAHHDFHNMKKKMRPRNGGWGVQPKGKGKGQT